MAPDRIRVLVGAGNTNPVADSPERHQPLAFTNHHGTCDNAWPGAYRLICADSFGFSSPWIEWCRSYCTRQTKDNKDRRDFGKMHDWGKWSWWREKYLWLVCVCIWEMRRSSTVYIEVWLIIGDGEGTLNYSVEGRIHEWESSGTSDNAVDNASHEKDLRWNWKL